MQGKSGSKRRSDADGAALADAPSDGVQASAGGKRCRLSCVIAPPRLFWEWGLGRSVRGGGSRGTPLQACKLLSSRRIGGRKRASESETELNEDPDANIGRMVLYKSGSSSSQASNFPKSQSWQSIVPPNVGS